MREPQLEVAVGMKEIGKTFTTKKIIEEYVKSDPGTGRKARPVLIMDSESEYVDNVKTIDFDIDNKDEYERASEIRDIKVPKAYRIFPWHKNRQPMTPDEIVTTCSSIFRYFRNGLIVLEDVNKYMLSTLNQDVIGQMIGNRHTGTDIIIHYQTLKAVPPRIWGNANLLRVHRYSDSVNAFDKDRTPNNELIRIAEIIVRDQYRKGNIHYYLWADILRDRFIPCINEGFEALFDEACITYLSQNKKELNNLINEEDIDGNKKYPSRQEAIRSWIQERKDQYLR